MEVAGGGKVVEIGAEVIFTAVREGEKFTRSASTDLQ
jgi:hypothetical protein